MSSSQDLSWPYRLVVALPMVTRPWRSAIRRVSRKSLASARPRLLGLDLAIACGRVGLQGEQEFSCCGGDFVDRTIERRGIRLRRPVEAGKLAHELQRRGADFLLGCRRVEIEQCLDVAAHGVSSLAHKSSKPRHALAILATFIRRASCLG